ncbi:MAG: hypothetical protein ACRDWN_01570 [Acidimicrobiales bacterium]
MGRPLGRRGSVLVFANPGDKEFLLPPGLGVQLWVEGHVVDGYGSWIGVGWQ